MSNKLKQRGFTLIELLVVIAIIGLLATVVLVSLNTARAKARDTKRVADLKQIQLAVEMFYDTTGSYPLDAPCNPDSSNGCAHVDDYWTSNGLTQSYNGHNISEFITLPIDSINDDTYYYQYEPHCNLGGTKQGYWIRVQLELEDGIGPFYVRGGIQSTDSGCENTCDSGPPCY